MLCAEPYCRPRMKTSSRIRVWTIQSSSVCWPKLTFAPWPRISPLPMTKMLPNARSCFHKEARQSPSSLCAATSCKHFPVQKTAIRGIFPHVLAFVIGVPGANKLLLKIETIRLSLWIEGEMRKQYGSKRRAKEELFARYASFVYLGNGRYGFAAASEYYFHKPIETFTLDDADKAAVLAGITKSPAEYAPTVEGLQKPTRRRNQILNLMVGNR